MIQPAGTSATFAAPSIVSDRPTHFASCPACGTDTAEPIGVTGAMDDVRNMVLAMRCGGCASIYLSPTPPTTARTRFEGPNPAEITRKRVRAWTLELAGNPRILMVTCGRHGWLRRFARHGRKSWELAGMNCDSPVERCAASDCSFTLERILQMPVPDETSRYDLVILPHSLESAVDPEHLLRHLHSLLADNGRILSIVANIDSPCFRLFGGRHWSAYRYPHTRQHLSRRGLDALCEKAGLRVARCATLYASRVWLLSLANWLNDWKAPALLGTLLVGRFGIARAAAAAIEAVTLIRDQGALLSAELVKPELVKPELVKQ